MTGVTGEAGRPLENPLVSAGGGGLGLTGVSAVIRSFPQGAIIVFDTDLRYLSAGGLGLAAVGLSRQMLEGRTIFEAFPADVAAVIEPAYRLALAGEESTMDVPFAGRVFLMRLAPLRDDAGAVVGGMGFTQDVTAARESERALRESVDRFRSAFENAPIGKALIGLDGRYEQVNPAMCTMTGYTRERLTAMTMADITHPEDTAADEAAMHALLADEVVTSTVEKRYLKPDGAVVWASKSQSLVRRADGSPLHFIAQVQDISERRAHEAQLAGERRRLRDAEAIGRVGSWEMDVTSGSLVWSDSMLALYGLDPAVFDGNIEAALACVHADDRQRVDAATQECLRTGEPLRVRYRVNRHDDGQVRWFDARGDALYEEGRIVRLTGAVADVTDQVVTEVELAQARDEALEASRQKSVFLSTMSHEIRTPMNAVIGMTGLLLDTGLDDEQREFTQTVRSSGDALLAILNDILDFSKIEAGDLDLDVHPFDLRECVESALAVVALSAAEKDVELVADLADSCPTVVVGDVTRLRQVIVNLLSNAIKFTPAGEIVLGLSAERLTASPTGPVRLHASVRDTGIGIPEASLNRLFHSFSQVDSSTTRLYGGTGLGLTISRRLVEAMGGSLAVVSEVGTGSTFTFSVVVTEANSRRASVIGTTEGPLVGRSVLLVDDNATNRRVLSAVLRRWGMVATDVSEPAAAVRLVSDGARFDLAVLDMHMPAMDGVALATALRAQRTGRGLPVVMLSSLQSRVDSQHRALVVTKPVKIQLLHERLVEALASARSGWGPSAGTGRRDPDPAPVGQRALRILLAEDNLVNQRVAQLMLRKLGHHVDTVSDGGEAVQAVHRAHFDVVLMDVQMPVLDGLTATQQIRDQLPAHRQPRIAAMTANASVEDRAACAAAGMDDYLTKPVRAQELADMLTSLTAIVVPVA